MRPHNTLKISTTPHDGILSPIVFSDVRLVRLAASSVATTRFHGMTHSKVTFNFYGVGPVNKSTLESKTWFLSLRDERLQGSPKIVFQILITYISRLTMA